MRTLVCLFIFVLPRLVAADSVATADSVETYVNVRSAPDAGAEVVGRLHKGIPLPLVDSVPGWHEVEVGGGVTGFVSADWSTVVAEGTDGAGQSEPIPVPEPESVPEPDSESEAPPGAATIDGDPGFLVRFREATTGENSQIFDNGNQVGIGTTTPGQRLEVNGNIQIREQASNVAGLMITQASGDTGYIMHNRANTLTIGAGSVDRITIDREGNVGIGVARPAHPLEVANGAFLSAGGVWTDSSSRQHKENIVDLSASDAVDVLARLRPVQYNYRNDSQDAHLGFIAEEVPDLVATPDRQGLSPMDIVAVLTKVVQAQQLQIEMLESRLQELE